MEIMRGGYVKLYRDFMDMSLFADEKVWKAWTWCLLKAAYRETKITICRQQITLQPGQFVMGRSQASRELGMSIQTVRRVLNRLQDTGNIKLGPTNRFTVVTVEGWAFQQPDSDEANQHPTNRCNSEPTNRCNSEPTNRCKPQEPVIPSVCVAKPLEKQGKPTNRCNDGPTNRCDDATPMIPMDCEVEQGKKQGKPTNRCDDEPTNRCDDEPTNRFQPGTAGVKGIDDDDTDQTNQQMKTEANHIQELKDLKDLKEYIYKEKPSSSSQERKGADIEEIYSFWNSQGVTVHKDLSTRIRDAIKKALKEHSKEDILTAIQRYSSVQKNPDLRYDWKYNLPDFMTRKMCIYNWLDDGTLWLNYGKTQGKPGLSRPQVNILPSRDKEGVFEVY